MERKIHKTFEVVNAIQDVKVSPFFKDKTMQRLFAEKEEQATVWDWFTPKLQMATLICVIALNLFAFTQYNASSYEEKLTDFASTYGLTTESDNTIFN